MKVTIYQALDWFDQQGPALDVAMFWVICLAMGPVWFMGRRRR